MHIFRKIIFILFCSLSVFSKTPEDILKFTPELEEYISETLKEWVAPGCAIAIIKDGKIIYAKGFGLREFDAEEKIDAHTVFQIASCSKPFLAALIAKLVDEGKLSWDDKVTKYIPEFILSDDAVTKEMTILDLVTHRSGLKGFSGDTLWNLHFSQSELIEGLRYIPLTHKHREQYSYQNHMFGIASIIVERVTHKSISELFDKYFFKPLAMENASTGIKKMQRKFWQLLHKSNIAYPHDVRDGKIYKKPITEEIYLFEGSSGVNASVTDMAKWLLAQLNDLQINGTPFLSHDTLNFIRTPKVNVTNIRSGDIQFPEDRFSDVAYCLGWFHQTYGVGDKKINFYSHMGAFNGVRSYMLFSPKERLGFVILSNFGSMRVSLLPEGLRSKFLDLYLDLPKVDWTKKVYNATNMIRKSNRQYHEMERLRYPMAKSATENYVGTYHNDLYGKIEIIMENHDLWMVYRKNRMKLTHWNGNAFRFKPYELTRTYSDHDENEVSFEIENNMAKKLMVGAMFEGKNPIFTRQ
jgi:CubicO group peptidase (beta-lactamase class C family)